MNSRAMSMANKVKGQVMNPVTKKPMFKNLDEIVEEALEHYIAYLQSEKLM